MTKIQSFKQFLEAKEVYTELVKKPVNELVRLGIYLNLTPDSFDGNVLFNWQRYKDSRSYTHDQVDKLDFFSKLSLKEEIALALAVTEESRNDYLTEGEINFVNHFFDLDIDRNFISKVGCRFI